MPKPTQEQLQRINRFSHSPRTEDNTFVFDNLMIDNLPTSYSSKVHPALLTKFVADAQKGIGLLTNHNHRSLPVGRSFGAHARQEVLEDGEMCTSVYGEFYIGLGRNTESAMTTDDIAAGIDDGSLLDTSIGFKASTWECSLCGHDIRDYHNCSHWPGETYEVKGSDGVHRNEKCYVIVGSDGDGELMENSIVFSGAAPRAQISKANFSADVSDFEKGSTLHIVENFKDLPLDAAIYSHYSKDGMVLFTNTAERTNGAEVLRQRSENEVELKQIVAVLGEFGLEAGDEAGLKAALAALSDKSAAQAELSTKTTELTAAQSELTSAKGELETARTELSQKDEQITDLKSQNEALAAKAGIADTYFDDLVTQTTEFAVRVFGNGFDADTFSDYLKTLSVEKVKAQLATFTSQHSANYAGARVTAVTPVDNEQALASADFDTEDEFRAHVAEEAAKYAKEHSVSLSAATKLKYAELSTKEGK